MRQIVIAFVAACTLVGCSPVVEPPPPPPTVEETPSGPVFTEKEQAVIDAVDRYLERLIQIGRDPVGEDWNTIREVAWDPAANNALIVYRAMLENGWHTEGETAFAPRTVMESWADHQGQRFDVYGCQAAEGPLVVDSDGNPVSHHEFEKTAYRYEVVRTPDGRFFVTQEISGEKQC